jgi:hypothetical protein
MQLAVENANHDCKMAIQPIKTKYTKVGSCVKACQGIGSATHQTNLLGGALKPKNNSNGPQNLGCYKCEQKGHMHTECPQNMAGNTKQGSKPPGS